jgi:hypothetical protein
LAVTTRLDRVDQYSRASRSVIHALENWVAVKPGDDGPGLRGLTVSHISTTFAHINRRAHNIGALHQPTSDSTFAMRGAPTRWNGLALDT